MNEKTRQEIDKEQAEKKAVEFENKLLGFLLPIVGIIAFILGLVGFILTVSEGQVGITVFYAVLFVLGCLGIFYGVVYFVRKKIPNFLRRKKVEAEDTVLAD